jgi:RimJ/RimL family protein N-acetyltransferase
VTRYVRWRTDRAVEEALSFVRDTQTSWLNGQDFCWAVTRKGEPHLIGTVSLARRDTEYTVGYILRRDYWGQGYATEALRFVLQALLSRNRLRRIFAACAKENRASAHVLEKNGFVASRILRKAIVYPNTSEKPLDAILYIMIPSEEALSG